MMIDVIIIDGLYRSTDDLESAPLWFMTTDQSLYTAPNYVVAPSLVLSLSARLLYSACE